MSGKVRVKTGGGTAGHNGIRSIDAHIGSGFHRVRLGIGHPGERHRVHGHVLGDFAKSDRAWLEPLLDAIAEHAGLLVTGGEASFQNKVHLALNPVDKSLADGAKELP
jgi:peptidyl-tRNA hydrolase, PTH1 family